MPDVNVASETVHMDTIYILASRQLQTSEILYGFYSR